MRTGFIEAMEQANRTRRGLFKYFNLLPRQPGYIPPFPAEVSTQVRPPAQTTERERGAGPIASRGREGGGRDAAEKARPALRLAGTHSHPAESARCPARGLYRTALSMCGIRDQAKGLFTASALCHMIRLAKGSGSRTARTAQLYPEWPLAATTRAGRDIRTAVAAALASINASHSAVRPQRPFRASTAAPCPWIPRAILSSGILFR